MLNGDEEGVCREECKGVLFFWVFGRGLRLIFLGGVVRRRRVGGGRLRVEWWKYGDSGTEELFNGGRRWSCGDQ